MKEQKGMGHLGLIISMIIIFISIVLVVYFAKNGLQGEKIQNYETDMLLIQGKVKVLSQESTAQKNESLLEGRKVSNNTENEKIKTLLENNVISKEEENFLNYYIIDKLDLEEMGLENCKLNDGYYIVNYDTYEVIYSEGVKIKGNIYYKLSEIQQQNEENNEEQEANTEEVVSNEEQKETNDVENKGE